MAVWGIAFCETADPRIDKFESFQCLGWGELNKGGHYDRDERPASRSETDGRVTEEEEEEEEEEEPDRTQ
ncbi:unnamed protein product [Gadus morhua 'NCC']